MASAVPIRTRIVEVVADLGIGRSPRYRYGSGLLIGDRQVLTAAHVVDGADAVVVIEPDKRRLTADVSSGLVGDRDHFDVAVLDVRGAPELPPVPLARVDRDVSSGELVIEGCWAVGYPEFQEVIHGDVPVRVTVQVRGYVPPLSGLGEGAESLLTLQVTATPRSLPGSGPLAQSEWRGMSGAAVFAGTLLLGVVTEHALRRGVSDISFTPLDRLFDLAAAPPDAAAWRARLGVSSDARLLPALPVAPERPEPPYRATLRTYRGRTGVLLERQVGLAAIEAFATGARDAFGPGTTPGGYLWLRGAPWAGKTALLAEAVYLAPEQVNVVAFFVNARESQVTQEHFFAAVIPQLAFLLDEDPPSVIDVSAFRRLWAEAEQRAAGRHLLLVVDGLDEGPTIASVLPESLTATSRVIVSSRLSFGLHEAVHPAHPLHDAVPIRLSATRAARNQQHLAEQEIKALLAPGTASDLAFDVLGMLAAVGGGLTVEDLAALTGCQRRAVRGFVDVAASRILEAAGHPPGSRYGFAHRSLQDACREHEDVGDPLYWRKITAWADDWAARHWPSAGNEDGGTPWYLLSNYPAALAGPDDAPPGSSDDYPRLAALVTDVAWVESAVATVGVDQVRAALAIASRRISDNSAIAAMLRLVEYDAPNLQPDQAGDLDPLGVVYFDSRVGDAGRLERFHAPWVGRSGFVIQQLLNRAVMAGNADVASAARAELMRRSLPWVELQWAAAGLPLRTLSSASYERVVGATRDGRRLLTLSQRTAKHPELTVWDTESGARLTLATKGAAADAVWAVSADGGTAVSATGRQINVWDLTTGEPVGQLAESCAAVTAVAIADDGTWSVMADETGGLWVWDLTSRASAPRAAARPTRHPIARITVFPGERRVLCATRYGDLETWDLEGSAQLIRHSEHRQSDFAVYSLAVSPDGQRAAYGSFDVHGPRPLGTVTVVDLVNGRSNTALTVPASAVPSGCTPLTSVAFLAGGRTLGGVYADAPLPSSDGLPRSDMLVTHTNLSTRLVKWELETGRVLVDCTLEPGWCGTTMTEAAYAFSAFQGRVAGWQLEPTPGHSAAVTGLACAEHAARAASVSRDGTLRIWEFDDGPSTRSLPPEPYYSSIANNEKLCVALSADGTRAVTGSYAEHLAAWDVDTGDYKILAPSYPRSWGNPRPPIRWVRAVAISADGRRAVSASGNTSELILWDLENSTELGRVLGTEVRVLAMTPDLRYGISDGPAWWDLSRSWCTPLPAAPTSRADTRQTVQVTAVALTGDGTGCAAGYADGTVQWWDTRHSPMEAGRVDGHAMGVHGLAFITRGTRLLSASGDRTVAIWDVVSGRELGRAAFTAPLRCLDASDAHVVVGDVAGGVHHCQWHDSAGR